MRRADEREREYSYEQHDEQQQQQQGALAAAGGLPLPRTHALCFALNYSCARPSPLLPLQVSGSAGRELSGVLGDGNLGGGGDGNMGGGGTWMGGVIVHGNLEYVLLAVPALRPDSSAACSVSLLSRFHL